ncbi:MAG: sodium:proton antiporter [Bacteroidaceae bacterium]|nr:sodium:proton antiporter [Bacteroidaceae bacterium]
MDNIPLTHPTSARLPHPLVALIPVAVLVGMMALMITLFGSDALGGGTQIALLMAAAVCISISMLVYRTKWKDFENGIVETVSSSVVSLCILLIIGMMSSTWMISGVVPTLIYYGVQILSPTYYLACTCVICAVVSVMTGSSWTTVATIGVALIGIGNALGIPEYWSAGAIISGAYFGDKISPLSDTTVLASSVAEVNLFTHIRYMLQTTIPSMCVALLIFGVAGFFFMSDGDVQVQEYTEHLAATYNISLWTLLVPVLTGVMIARRVPSLITLFASSLLAGLCALLLQPDILVTVAGSDSLGLGRVGQCVKGMLMTFFTSTSVDTGSATVNELVATSGMAGMLNTIWLILCAMCFGGAMVASGMLQSLTRVIIRAIRGTTSLVASTACSGILSNILTCDQYISIILTVSMFKNAYREKGYEGRLLSRTTEDATTVTSVLVPWNTCGMTQSTVLGVPTLAYLPFCFFNYISPLMSIIVSSIKVKPNIHEATNNSHQ